MGQKPAQKQETEEERADRLAKEGAEKKKKIGEMAKKLFQRLTTGCQKVICFSRFCRKNPT